MSHERPTFELTPVSPATASGPGPRWDHLASEGPRELDLAALLRKLLRGWWMVVVATAATLGMAVFYLKKAPKRYQSTATVQVEQERRPLLPANSPDGGREDIRALEILKTIEQGLISQNNLKRVAEATQLSYDPEFSHFEGEAELIKALSRKVRAELRRGTRLIDVNVEDTDPERARRLAAALVEQYIQATADDARQQAQTMVAQLRESAKRLQERIQETHERLAEYRRQYPEAALEKETPLAAEKLRDLNTKLSQIIADRARLEAAARELQALGPKPDIDAILKLQGSVAGLEITQMRNTLAQKEAEFTKLQQTFGPRHPKYQAAFNELQSLRTQVAQLGKEALSTLKASVAHLAATEKKLRQQVEQAQAEAAEAEEVSGPYRLLQSQLNSDQASYEAVQAELKQAEIAALAPPSILTLADAPVAATRPSKPVKTLVLGVAALGGMGLGTGAALVTAFFRRRFETVRETEQMLRVPFLAAIPSAGRRRRFSLLGEPRVEDACAEAFRSLRTAVNVLTPSQKSPARSTLFVSANRHEGTSFVAANYALSLARQGYRTLLIDANLHIPVLDEVFFGTRNPAGLTAYLEGRPADGDPCRATRFPDLFLLSAGVTTLHPSELLSGKKFQLLLEDAQRWFHRIVIDAPSLSTATDALLMARHADHTVLVVNGGRYGNSPLTTEVCRRIAQAGISLTGFVFNEAAPGTTPWQPSSPQRAVFTPTLQT